MSSIKGVGNRNSIVRDQVGQISSNQEPVTKSGANIDPAKDIQEFEKSQSSEFLTKALSGPLVPARRKELLTEANVNKFIQNNVKVDEQVTVARDLGNWVKSNFRLHKVQEDAVNSWTKSDLDTAEKAATRATELNTKLQIKFGTGNIDEKLDSGKLKQFEMEESQDAVRLKYSAGCEVKMMEQLQQNMNKKQIL